MRTTDAGDTWEKISDLKPELQTLRSRFDEIVATEVLTLNRIVAGLSLPPVVISSKPAATNGQQN